MAIFKVIDAPSTLGLWPSGVEEPPAALKSVGLIQRLNADDAGAISPPAFSDQRDPDTLIRNSEAIRGYSQAVADRILPVIKGGQFPILLGGDCSILIGAMLGLRRIGQFGLMFLDGHADFYQPEADPYGEAASMELAIVTGRGPKLLTDIEGLHPLIRDQDVAVFGYRDADTAVDEGSQDIRQTSIRNHELHQLRTVGLQSSLDEVLKILVGDDLEGFWIHLDADVLSDTIMPAVDYRQPDGLSYEELAAVLQRLMRTGKAVGMTVTIFNPKLDPDGRIAQAFAECIVSGLTLQRLGG